MYLGIDERYIGDVYYGSGRPGVTTCALRVRDEFVQSYTAKKVLEPYWASSSLRQRALNSLYADMHSTNATIVALLANIAQ
jgi:hypothetical protein